MCAIPHASMPENYHYILVGNWGKFEDSLENNMTDQVCHCTTASQRHWGRKAAWSSHSGTCSSSEVKRRGADPKITFTSKADLMFGRTVPVSSCGIRAITQFKKPSWAWDSGVLKSDGLVSQNRSHHPSPLVCFLLVPKSHPDSSGHWDFLPLWLSP